MLRLGNVRFRFGSIEQNARWVAQELPYFARFLMGWQIPEPMQDMRYGVKAYQHESMKQAVAEHGVAHTVVEILSKVFSEMAATDELGEDGRFTGTATDLMAVIRACGQAGADYVKEIGNIARLRYALKQICKAYPAVKVKTVNRIEEWDMPYKFMEGAVEWNA